VIFCVLLFFVFSPFAVSIRTKVRHEDRQQQPHQGTREDGQPLRAAAASATTEAAVTATTAVRRRAGRHRGVYRRSTYSRWRPVPAAPDAAHEERKKASRPLPRQDVGRNRTKDDQLRPRSGRFGSFLDNRWYVQQTLIYSCRPISANTGVPRVNVSILPYTPFLSHCNRS